MALPSSPPLLPQDEGTVLLPHAFGSSAPIRPANRKRPHSDYETLSSDPWFSDDTEEDAGQDVAELPRRKRQVKGPWWRLRGRGGPKVIQGGRNADSGVFMGSDASEMSVDSVMSSQLRMRELAMEDMEEEELPRARMLAPRPSAQPERAQTTRPEDDTEIIAVRIIERCLEDGDEVVDLSGISLANLQDTTLIPLRTLMCHSVNDFEYPPDEESFAPLIPSIKVYLATNELTNVPNELFNLSNITVLSLRGNQLTELPPAIGRLNKLKELNIAGNSIRYLPWELLDLMHCRNGKHRNIMLRPNPLIQPCDLSGPSPLPKAYFSDRAVDDEELSRCADVKGTVERMRQKATEDGVMSLRGELELRLKLGRMLRILYIQEATHAGTTLELCREELIYLGSSTVKYFDVDGSPIRLPGSGKANAATEDQQWAFSPGPTAHNPRPTQNSHSRVPSLFELALHSLQDGFNLAGALPDLADMGLPKTVASALHLAAARHDKEKCSTCGRDFLLARARWVEYWFNGFPRQRELSENSVLPFLRKACSWGCAMPTAEGQFRC